MVRVHNIVAEELWQAVKYVNIGVLLDNEMQTFLVKILLVTIFFMLF